jgi:hypothetical protein
MEDEDLYRFLHEAHASIGGQLVTLCDGRTPWQVYEKERYIGDSRIDPCSKILKRKLLDKWRNENCDPETSTFYVGIDWTEKHRLDRLQKLVAPWRYEAPLLAPPYTTKWMLLAELKEDGIEPPRLYKMGFAHNNCGGFCCKAGHSHFRHLLATMPDRYRYHEEQEARLRGLGINGAILKTQVGGIRRKITLREFREAIESDTQGNLFEEDDLAAGCGCAL